MTINFIRLDSKTAGRVLVLLAYLLFAAVFILPLSTAQAADSSNMNKSPEEIVQQMKERLRLTEEQVAKIRPIIDESFNKCRDILDNNGQDKKSNRSALQEVRWKTDMKLGQILTEQQMSDYQNFFEEKSEKSQQDDMHHGKGGRSGGGMRAF
jgi:Spy/CpxP family protein refolding chaperone